MKPKLTQERLKQLLDYFPETGLFKWKVQNGRRIHVGDIAGSPVQKGYLVIGIDSRVYRAHRLAWLYVHGEWPIHYIDHKNGVVTDNRIENLRDVTNEVNNQNKRKTSCDKKSCDLLGACKEKRRNRWRSVITLKGKQIHIGYFDTPEDAHQAYLDAKRKLHTGCTI